MGRDGSPNRLVSLMVKVSSAVGSGFGIPPSHSGHFKTGDIVATLADIASLA